MDPDANLKEQLELAADIQKRYDADLPIYPDDGAHLSELVLALNEWMSRGGFKPRQWT